MRGEVSLGGVFVPTLLLLALLPHLPIGMLDAPERGEGFADLAIACLNLLWGEHRGTDRRLEVAGHRGLTVGADFGRFRDIERPPLAERLQDLRLGYGLDVKPSVPT